tara:strand:+ start:1354 stop:2775 length:1422 start_codon:yes stop_codon:yes gene_type:complete
MVIASGLEIAMDIFCIQEDKLDQITDLIAVSPGMLESVVATQTQVQQRWLAEHGFQAKVGQICVLPATEGGIDKVLFGWEQDQDLWSFAKIIDKLPLASYRLCLDKTSLADHQVMLAYIWGCHCYSYTNYKSQTKRYPQISVHHWTSDEKQALKMELQATYKVRDWINTPAEDCSPEHIELALRSLEKTYQATLEVVTGDDLLPQGYPLIHTVGRASHRPAKMLCFRWGRDTDPVVALVGKGICFDTGGLQVKPHTSMQTMKKDMGGAAHMISLCEMIMQSKLPVQVVLWLACADNAIGGNAFRPGDVYRSRNGMSVEIGHTDAEGRLVLADILTAATEEAVDLVIDYATLTGAQRVALGMSLPAIFTNNTNLAQILQSIGDTIWDPVWQLPLYKPYKKDLASPIADLSSTGSGPYAGAITAALFLESFLKGKPDWVHIDAGAYNTRSSPGKPLGGEAMALRTLFRYIKQRYN